MRRLLVFLATLLVALSVLAPVTYAADGSMSPTGPVLFAAEGDITVSSGDHADLVLVVRGTAAIAGEVNTIVVLDGRADLTGATAETVVAVRSPVTLDGDTTVLGDVMTLDAEVTQADGAQVNGAVRDIALDLAGVGFFLGPALVLLYVGFTIAAVAAGLLLAALAARQVRAAEALISRQPLEAFLAAIAGIIVPTFAVVALFVTIVGAPLAIAILIGLWPLVAFVGYLVAGIWVGDFILLRTSPGVVRERPYLAAVIGLVVLQVLGIVPFITMVASVFGYGAVILLAWRTFRTGSVGTPTVRTAAPEPLPG